MPISDAHADDNGRPRDPANPPARVRLRDRVKRLAAAHGSAAFVLLGGSPRALRYLSTDPSRRGMVAALVVSPLFTIGATVRVTAERARRLLSTLRPNGPGR